MQARKEEEQRVNLCHTCCNIHRKVYGLIINCGSCTNVASTTLVSKPNLATTKHPHPYHLSLLNNGGALKVTEQVVVPFTIGSYKDEVIYDVVPMSASHFLLGRPWQFDHEVVHDGHANIYSVSKGRKHVLLTPLNLSQEKQHQLENSKVTKESLFANKGEDICQSKNFVSGLQQGKKRIKTIHGDLVWIHRHKERFHIQRIVLELTIVRI